MKIDDYLHAHHNQVPFEAVIEPLSDDPTRIRITPARPGGSCLCVRSLVLDKACVAEVEPTARTIACCGKLRRIVRITLRDDAQVPALEVVSDLLREDSGARASDGQPWDPDGPAACQAEAIRRYKGCVNGCHGAADPEACRARCAKHLQDQVGICFGYGD